MPWIYFAILFLSACGKVSLKDKNAPDVSVSSLSKSSYTLNTEVFRPYEFEQRVGPVNIKVVQDPLALDTFNLQMSVLPDAGYSQVQVLLDTLNDGREKAVSTLKNLNPRQRALSFPKAQTSYDLLPQGRSFRINQGVRYRLTLTCIHYNVEAQVCGHGQVDIPSVLVINHLTKLEKDFDLRVDQFHLGPKAVLVTNGFLFKVQTRDLIAHASSSVRSYTENHAAPEGKQGRTPALIAIEAKAGYGRLNIFSIGERGGPGLTGAPHKNRAQAGRNGDSGDGDWTRGSCYRMPTLGLPGSDGARGNPGGDGFRGGNSGNIWVSVEYAKNLYVHIDQLPGAGGAKGQGGPGQMGGEGGRQGLTMGCKASGEKAPDGKTGPQGPPGEKEGSPGNHEGQYCLELGNLVQGNCNPK